jgi:tungstate transport system substrate-binding protein
LIHGSDETYQLQAQGLAAPLRAWAQNEHVIVGPADDPAKVGEAHDGIDAIRRISAADAPLIGFRDPGSFSTMQHLWRAAGLRPGPRQQLYDDGEQPQQVLKAAARQGAYVVIGHMPVAFGKVPAGNYRVLLAGDPDMRRVYVAVEPGPHHPATTAQRERAHRLAEYLLGTEGQAALVAANRTIATPERPGPWVFPLPR